MIAIHSQCWTLDSGAHADQYVALYESFEALHLTQPGYRGRRLLRGLEDPTHFTNVRFFDAEADYHALVHHPDYAPHIEAMGRHLDLSRPPVKEVVEVVVDSDRAS